MASGEFAEIRITVAEGGGLSEAWVLKDSSGTAIDVTGDTFTADVKASYSTAATSLLDISPSVTDGTAGEITFTVAEDAAAMTALAVGEYVFDLFRQPSGGVRLKIAQGPFVKTAAATDF